MQGVGQALSEEAVYDESGQLITGSMMDYAIPTANSVPSIITDRTTTPSPTNPLGVKGAGETGTIAASPAVDERRNDALSPFGVTHMNMPAKPEKSGEPCRGKLERRQDNSLYSARPDRSVGAVFLRGPN